MLPKSKLTEDNYALLGWVAKTHGLKGNIVIKLKEELRLQSKIFPPIFIEIQAGSFIPFKINKFQLGPHLTLNIKLDGVDSCEQAQELKQKKIWVEKKYKNHLFIIETNDFIGFKIKNITEYDCFIENIIKMGATKVFQTTICNKEVLLPAGDDLIEKIDLQKKEIYLKIPPGLIDIYLT